MFLGAHSYIGARIDVSGYYQGMHGTGKVSSTVDSQRIGRRSGRLRFAGKAGMCLRAAGAAAPEKETDIPRYPAERLSGIRKACGPSPCSSGTRAGKNSTEMCTAGSSSAYKSGNCAGPTERRAARSRPHSDPPVAACRSLARTACGCKRRTSVRCRRSECSASLALRS